MRSRVFVLASILLMSACGGAGSPDAPGSPTSPGPVVSLPDGEYLLAVHSAGLGCFVATFNQGSMTNNAVSIPVDVSADGGRWHVAAHDPAAGSLAMSLSRTEVGVDGSAWGTLTQPGVSVTLQHQLNGTANGPAPGVVGSIEGTVNYSGSNGTAFCNTNLWSLTRQGQ